MVLVRLLELGAALPSEDLRYEHVANQRLSWPSNVHLTS